MNVKESLVKTVATEESYTISKNTMDVLGVTEPTMVIGNGESTNNSVATISKLDNSTDYNKIYSFIWIFGIGLIAMHSAYETLKLSKSLKHAQHVEDNIYTVDNMNTAFVFGIIRPKIYLPKNLNVEEKSYVLTHEQIHLRKGDHLLKFFAFCISVIHWFNPLVWFSYYLMNLDMEYSCHEAVVKQHGLSIKKDYTNSLLSFSTEKKTLSPSPIAFGEGNLKGRIKNVLSYKKPKLIVTALSVTLLLITAAGCLSTNEIKTRENYAKDAITKEMEGFNSHGIEIEDYEIIRFEEAVKFNHIMNNPVELWTLEYKLKPKDLAEAKEKVDGQFEGDWIIRDGGSGLSYFLFSEENGEINLYGEFLSNLNIQGLEGYVREVLENRGMVSKVSYEGVHKVFNYKVASGSTYKILLSKPIRQDDGGIWIGERIVDSQGNIYRWGYPEGSDMESYEYFKLLQERVDNGEETWRLDPRSAAIDYLQNTLGPYTDKNYVKAGDEFNMETFYEIAEVEYRGYFMDMFKVDDTDGIHIDNIEWLTLEDTGRLQALGIDHTTDMPNGYYINNPEKYPHSIFLNDDTVYNILQYTESGVEHTQVTFDEFKDYFSREEGEILLSVLSKSLDAIEISEIYLP